MDWRTVVVSFAFLAAALCCDSAMAVDCTECTDCAADPVFVQKDVRSPALVCLLRKFASRRMNEEGLTAVVVLSEIKADNDGTLRESNGRLVLVGDRGAQQVVEVTGSLPGEVKAILGTDPKEDQAVDAQ